MVSHHIKEADSQLFHRDHRHLRQKWSVITLRKQTVSCSTETTDTGQKWSVITLRKQTVSCSTETTDTSVRNGQSSHYGSRQSAVPQRPQTPVSPFSSEVRRVHDALDTTVVQRTVLASPKETILTFRKLFSVLVRTPVSQQVKQSGPRTLV